MTAKKITKPENFKIVVLWHVKTILLSIINFMKVFVEQMSVEVSVEILGGIYQPNWWCSENRVMWKVPGTCIQWLMNVNEAKEVCLYRKK